MLEKYNHISREIVHTIMLREGQFSEPHAAVLYVAIESGGMFTLDNIEEASLQDWWYRVDPDGECKDNPGVYLADLCQADYLVVALGNKGYFYALQPGALSWFEEPKEVQPVTVEPPQTEPEHDIFTHLAHDPCMRNGVLATYVQLKAYKDEMHVETIQKRLDASDGLVHAALKTLIEQGYAKRTRKGYYTAIV